MSYLMVAYAEHSSHMEQEQYDCGGQCIGQRYMPCLSKLAGPVGSCRLIQFYINIT